MEYRKLGQSNIEVSEITLGCWAMGGGKEWGKSLEDRIYQETVITAFDRGINFFDTAMGYGGGHSEEVLGHAIKDIRDKIYLSSKCSATGLTKKKARESVELSLSRLGTDMIDVYFIHWPNPDVPVEESVEQLMKLKEEGKIGAIGVSNYTLEHLKRAEKAGQIDVLQPSYSLYWRHIERDLLPYCLDKNIGIISYSSIAQGLLTGKFTKDWEFAETDMRNGKIPLFISPTFEMAIDATEEIREIAKNYGKTPVQAAINWIVNKPGITSAIVGAKRPEQVLENTGATGWKLSDEDRDKIGVLTLKVAETVMEWDTMYLKDDHRLEIKA